MAIKKMKEITVTILNQEHVRQDWLFDFAGEQFRAFCKQLIAEMKKLGFVVSFTFNKESTVKINSYADLLNVAKISLPDAGHVNQCVGHVIGKSENLDILEDIRTAVQRVAFAPETIAPSNEFRKVCHNCGCGC